MVKGKLADDVISRATNRVSKEAQLSLLDNGGDLSGLCSFVYILVCDMVFLFDAEDDTETDSV